MKLKTKYILFMATLHLIFVVLSYLIFENDKLLFIVSEIIIIISVVVAIRLYRQLVQPLVYLNEGINAIKDKDFNVKFLPTGKPDMDNLISVYNQMIDELRIERTKQEEQHFFLEKLIHTSPTGIIILDYDGEVTQINPKASLILSPLSPLSTLSTFSTSSTFSTRSPNVSPFFEQIAHIKPGESKVLRIGGFNTYKIQKSYFIDRGFSRVFVMIEEVTTEIFEAEKNAYGKVIRMMAHEVNNTIGPVNSIINMALDHESLWVSKDRDGLKNAMHVAVERNQNLNLFMRNFADLVKLSPVNKRSIDLCSLIRSVSDFMQINAHEHQVSFQLNLPVDPFYISADIQQMGQVLINIFKNAIEAIDHQGMVTVNIDTKLKQLIISDTGAGISDSLSEQLFSPFFSTKKDGQGIGLTLVREILLNHGFEFSLKTVKPGQTDFVINLNS